MLDPSEKEEHFVLSVLWGVNAYIYVYIYIYIYFFYLQLYTCIPRSCHIAVLWAAVG